MAIDSTCTVSELKQKFIQQTQDIVLLFMGSVLNDQKTLVDYKIGCTNVTTVFVAERIRSKYTEGGVQDTQMQAAIMNNIEHPTLAHIKIKLSAALGVKKERIHITEVFAGSDCFKYTVNNLTFTEKRRIIQSQPGNRLEEQFNRFLELRIHPLLFRPAFDVASFDKRGNKSFVSKSSTFQVGPANMKKKYTQPTGWMRYGLKVLGKYGTDTWLHPFGDNDNWWRAFRGTKNATERRSVDPADAVSNIHDNGFLISTMAARYGPGVYCSPKSTEAERYAAEVNVETRAGVKRFRFMLQVAVKSAANTLTAASTVDIWSVKNKDDIRAYGILIKEIQ